MGESYYPLDHIGYLSSDFLEYGILHFSLTPDFYAEWNTNYFESSARIDLNYENGMPKGNSTDWELERFSSNISFDFILHLLVVITLFFISSFMCISTGVLSSLSLGIWDEKFFGLSFFDLLDFVTAKLMLPLSGLLVCLFVGWYLKRSVSYEELTNYGLQKAPYFPVYMFILKYLAPVVILLIFVNELGWLS